MTLPRFRLRTLMIAVVLVGGLLVGFVASCRRLETWGTAVHMRSVTRSLAQWGQEYAAVRNWRDVERAIGMLEYAGRYYVPGPGYRSDRNTEAALAEQRRRTLRAIATALREYTGQDFGVDATRWQVWAVNQVRPRGHNVPPEQDRGPDLPPD